MTRPDGTSDRVHLEPADDRYRGTVHTSSPGTYHMRVQARGHTSKGIPFQREQRVTGAVWHGGDHDAETSASGGGPAARERARRRRLCETLHCLLSEDGALTEEFVDRLEAAGIDVDAIRSCVGAYCHDLNPERIEEGGAAPDHPPEQWHERDVLEDVEDQLRRVLDDLGIDR
ncbi:hypothetical protein [Natrinema halophilum]|uniref:Uncharacterized protein n=1 Tax=Natrinema halophilum TaxID=1699371 RepID=A0A7D5GSZ3_9EURY|nr:hypothetical protein [Natrinema halophilum]QLG48966.1 hypothetical protein HYG82_08935 [Natrinema halophilum]